MIRCLPKGLCSWDFSLSGEGREASVEFDWLTEQGSIVVDRMALEVRKHGPLSGHWTLEDKGQPLVTAEKGNPFVRRFEIRCGADVLELSAQTPFGRTFLVERSGTTLATIAPAHPMTRRATIETLLDDTWTFTHACFPFWLTVLTWRRAAARSNP